MAAIRQQSDLRLPRRMRPVIDLVLAVAGQWRMVGGGMGPMRPAAFDLVAVDVAARWLGIAPEPTLLRELKIVELEALRAMREEP